MHHFFAKAIEFVQEVHTFAVQLEKLLDTTMVSLISLVAIVVLGITYLGYLAIRAIRER